MTTIRNVTDLRETSDTYAQEVCRQDLSRVILCPDRIQWIIQTASRTRPGVWRGESYCTTRKALIREWLKRTHGQTPEALSDLPERISLLSA